MWTRIQRFMLAGLLATVCTTAAQAGWFSPSRVGMAIRYELEASNQPKHQVEAFANTGHRLFGSHRLSSHNGGTLSTGAPLPDSVRFSWYTERAAGGLVLPEHRVEHEIAVAPRIPAAVIAYARGGRGRAVFVTFRLHDHGVKLAWSVQETVRHPLGGSGWVYSLHGGDFNCDAWRISKWCTPTSLKDAPWYMPEWLHER